MKVEYTYNVDLGEAWICKIIKVEGLLVCLRFLGSYDSLDDVWVNVCGGRVHGVGYCKRNYAAQIFLVPPPCLNSAGKDWNEFLMEELVGAHTLPADFDKPLFVPNISDRYQVNSMLELVDKKQLSHTRLARISQVRAERLCMEYLDSKLSPTGQDFWCHFNSPLIHPLGWSALVGHSNSIPAHVNTKSLKMLETMKYEADECSWSSFKYPQIPSLDANSSSFGWKVGMKLEAVDPLYPSSISVASVHAILKFGFLMITIDGSDRLDQLCFHPSSSHLLPAGYCELHGLKLRPPKTWSGPFSWTAYLKETGSSIVPAYCFDLTPVQHNFKLNMSLEAVDVIDPHLICVVTVVKLVGRLMLLHFDEWDDVYDQWVDVESADIYPIGFCEAAGFPLEPPKSHCNKVFPPANHKSLRTSTNRKRRRASSACKPND